MKPFLAAAAMMMLAPAAQASDRKPVDPNKMICHYDVPTGSRFPLRACHTAAQWAEIEGTNGRVAQTTLEHVSRNGLGATGGADGR